MSDHNRGAYTPQSEAPLAFDARRASGPGQRPMPVTLIISVVILAVLVVGFIVLYRNGPRGGEGEAVVAGDPVGAIKTPPPAEAKATEAGAGLQVYADGQPVPAAPSFAPGPEQPITRQAPVAAAPLPAAPAPGPVAQTAPVAAQPVAPVAALPVAKSPPAPAPAPAVKTAAAPPPAPKAAPVPKAAPTSGGPSVQVGAYSSTALADAGWNDAARALPGQMAGKTKRIEPVDVGGTTNYRTLIGGFANRAEAVAFCDALKAQARACLVR